MIRESEGVKGWLQRASVCLSALKSAQIRVSCWGKYQGTKIYQAEKPKICE